MASAATEPPLPTLEASPARRPIARTVKRGSAVDVIDEEVQVGHHNLLVLGAYSGTTNTGNAPLGSVALAFLSCPPCAA